MNRDEAGEALVALSERIADLQLEIGEIRYSEVDARAGALVHSREESVTQQRLDAESAAAPFVRERCRLEADLAAALAGRDLLQFLVKYRLEGVVDATSPLLQAG